MGPTVSENMYISVLVHVLLHKYEDGITRDEEDTAWTWRSGSAEDSRKRRGKGRSRARTMIDTWIYVYPLRISVSFLYSGTQEPGNDDVMCGSVQLELLLWSTYSDC